MFRLVLVCGLMGLCSASPSAATPVNISSNNLLAARFHSLGGEFSRPSLYASTEFSPVANGSDLVAFQRPQSTSSSSVASNGLLFFGMVLALFRWLQPAFAPRRFGA